MIGYVTIGTNDFDKAAAFYDALFKEMGAGRMMASDNFIAWGTGMDAPAISIIRPNDGRPATAGNGTMIAMPFDSHDKVAAIHARALELGAEDEGEPGVRNGSFYAAYFRDLDGNKFCCFNMGGGA